MNACPECGEERESMTPSSAMGFPMAGRGADDEICWNPRCPKFGQRC